MQEMQRSFMGLPWTASVSEGTSTHTGKQTLTAEWMHDQGRGYRGEGWENKERRRKERKKNCKTNLKTAYRCVYAFTCTSQVSMTGTGTEGDAGDADDPDAAWKQWRGSRCRLDPYPQSLRSRQDTRHQAPEQAGFQPPPICRITQQPFTERYKEEQNTILPPRHL